jgi:hypothetical protein
MFTCLPKGLLMLWNTRRGLKFLLIFCVLIMFTCLPKGLLMLWNTRRGLKGFPQNLPKRLVRDF